MFLAPDNHFLSSLSSPMEMTIPIRFPIFVEGAT
jgi:hypothetical protein